MNIYISGISGTGMGPLALMAKAAGFGVSGSDLGKGAIYGELMDAGIEVEIGRQDGEFLKQKLGEGVDWFVYTSALPDNHAELAMAKAAGIKVTKRDELTAYLVEELGLKMVAVAGTHGKTTTTAMIIYAALKLGLPVSYIAGTTLGFAPSGAYKLGDRYFIYEADEYDRNFLKYHPWLAVIPSVSYDHPDIYPTKEDYLAAFRQFEMQSRKIIDKVDMETDEIKLAGEVRRKDAVLALRAIEEILVEERDGGAQQNAEEKRIIDILNTFPGVGRRFERIKDGMYTDYAHHPEEIEATMGIVKDEKRLRGKKGIVVVYQPHQNTRQHEVRDGYRRAFNGADKIFWLPTYLTRENPKLEVLTPEQLIAGLDNCEVAEAAELNDELAARLKHYLAEDHLVILMTAGPADEWLRKELRRED